VNRLMRNVLIRLCVALLATVTGDGYPPWRLGDRMGSAPPQDVLSKLSSGRTADTRGHGRISGRPVEGRNPDFH
jgi:hypothetical protein